MKIIIYVDFSSTEFNKDFIVSQELINHEYTVLLVNNLVQLESAYLSYDILLYGNSYNGNNDFDKLKSFDLKNKNIDEVIEFLCN